MTQIKNVVFDLGGVLVDLDLNRCIAAFERLELHAIAKLINPYHPAEMIARLEVGEIDFHQTCNLMRDAANCHEVSDEQIAAAYCEFLVGIQLFKLRQIEALRQSGIRTFVLSNNNTASMKAICRFFTQDGKTIDDYFDHLYLSYEMKVLKPHAEIFQQMAQHGDMIPEQTLFIDDAEHNVNAARELGFAVYKASPDEDFGHLFTHLIK